MLDDRDDDGPVKQGTARTIDQLVDNLPEIYQPIFGHPDLSARVTRQCEDRLVYITQIYRTLEAALGRPLRVLDLGCAQGFFSLSLAKLGATVFGIDLQDHNITVCKALAAEHAHFKVSFQKGLIEEIILHIKQDQYDLVLGLSVFHHLVHIVGLRIVQEMLAILANATVAGIYEIASSCEPTQRASSQPENTRQLLIGYAFVHEFARHATHLRDSNRPLYVCSNFYWFLNEQVGRFDTWKDESHALSKNSYKGTRRYFFGKDILIKLFLLDDTEFHDINLQEYTNESVFLTSPPHGIMAPKLFLHGKHQYETWIVREQFSGELLLDKILNRKPYNAATIIQHTLEQLAVLEAHNLYHNDLRTWNIVIGVDGQSILIDYGAVTKEKKDRGWPYNIFLSFMIYMHEVISGDLAISDPIRPTFFNPDCFAPPYKNTLWKLLELPPNEWSFAFLCKALSQPDMVSSTITVATKDSFAMLIRTMENACEIHRRATTYRQNNAKQSNLIMNKTSNDKK